MVGSYLRETLNTYQLRAIGLVCVEWALLEKILEQGIWELAFSNNGRGNVFTSNFQIHTMIKVFEALLHENPVFSKAIKKFEPIKGKINTANGERRKIVHGNWAPSTGGDLIYINWRKGKRLNAELEKIKTKDLLAIANNISSVAEELNTFMKESVYEPLSWLEIGVPPDALENLQNWDRTSHKKQKRRRRSSSE